MTIKLKNGIVAVLSLMHICLFGQLNKVDFQKFELENGLEVILHKDNSTPIVAVSVMYHVGSKNEETNRTGFAHFFEHLLFEGTDNIQRGEYDKYVEKAGGTLNANTWYDRTYYFEILPSNQLELGLWLESERMLHAKVEQKGIETQREVVKEERRQRVDNQPYGSLLEESMKRAYTQHPYRWPVIGSMEHLSAAEEQDYKNFYKKFYVPNNAIVSIAGDIDYDNAKALVHAMFFNKRRYSMGEVGRFKLNQVLGLNFPNDPKHRLLQLEDLTKILSKIIELNNGIGDPSDVDFLGNRRVKSMGELLQWQMRVGFLRMEKNIKERMSLSPREKLPEPSVLIS
ncbi:MAG TPA: insulinase family protein, partial [Saprospiraceae bacterium]|nr:insulinase family protein [Saprospiraceae bacterium]